MFFIVSESNDVVTTEFTMSDKYAFEYYTDRCDELVEDFYFTEDEVKLYDIDETYLADMLLDNTNVGDLDTFLYKHFYYSENEREWMEYTNDI